MAYKNQWKDKPRNEPYLLPVNGIVQPPVTPPPNRPGRRTNVLDSLKSLLKDIWRKRWAVRFRNPVDSKALGAPDYHTLIKRPMDLSTIWKRLNNNYYCQASEAIEDFTLIFENCMLYNKEGTVVHQAGQDLKILFQKLLAKIDLTNEVQVKPKPKSGKRKKPSEEKPSEEKPSEEKPSEEKPSEEKPSEEKPSEEKPPSGSKRFCPGPKLPSPKPAATVQPAPTQPPLPLPLFGLKDADRMIERRHCKNLLKAMRKQKYHHITWIFNRAKNWPLYTQNKDYNYKAERKLDWPILEDQLNSDDFESLDSFVALVHQMFQNGLRCFSEKSLIRSNIKKTISVFDAKLVRFKELVKNEKDFARAVWAHECQKTKLSADKAANSTKPGSD